MPNYFDRNEKSVVTQFAKRRFREYLQTSQQKRKSSGIPAEVGFLLSDHNVILKASTDHEIIIGRRPRPEDPPVAVDLGAYEGHKQGVSRCHAMIAPVGETLVLRDLDSVNGTLINGKNAVPLKSYTLADGDEITLGSLKLILRFFDSADQ